MKTNTVGWELNITEIVQLEAPTILEDDPIPDQIRQDLLEIKGDLKTRITMHTLVRKIQKHKVDMAINVKRATDRYEVAKLTPWFSVGNFGGGFGLVTIFAIIIVLAIIGCVAWKCWQRHQAKAAVAGLAMAFPRAVALETADPGVLLVKEKTLMGCPSNPGDSSSPGHTTGHSGHYCRHASMDEMTTATPADNRRFVHSASEPTYNGNDFPG